MKALGIIARALAALFGLGRGRTLPNRRSGNTGPAFGDECSPWSAAETRP